MLRREEAEIDVDTSSPTLRQELVLGDGRAGGCRRRAQRLGLTKHLVEALHRAGPRRHDFRLEHTRVNL